MLSDAERLAVDHLRAAASTLRDEQARLQAGGQVAAMAVSWAIQAAEAAERAVYALAGQRDADDAVQAEYLAKVLAGVEAAHVDAAQVESLAVDDKTGAVMVTVRPAPVEVEPVEPVPVEAEPLVP